MTHIRTALIIGGGIAGPAAAMALQQAGIDSVIYEAHPTGAEGIGVFLTLGSNGIDALRTICPRPAHRTREHPRPSNSSPDTWRRSVPRWSTTITGCR